MFVASASEGRPRPSPPLAACVEYGPRRLVAEAAPSLSASLKGLVYLSGMTVVTDSFVRLKLQPANSSFADG